MKDHNQKITNKAINDLIKTVNNFKAPFWALQNFSEIMNRHDESVKMASRLLNEQAEVIQNAFRTFNVFAPKLKELQDFVSRAREAFKHKIIERDAILKSGWWFTPSLMEIPAGQIDEAIEKYTKGQNGAMTHLFVSIYQSKNCAYLSQVIEEWQGNKYFKPWKQHLEQSLRAHIRGEYNLSIPVLLLVAEGIAKNYCKDKKISFNWAKGNDKITKALKNAGYDDEEIEKNLYMLEIDLFFASIDDKIYKKTSLLKKTRGFRYILNRHAVLHGVTCEYGTRKNSLQGFMLLDVLSLLK